jgi:hypothetical protein
MTRAVTVSITDSTPVEAPIQITTVVPTLLATRHGNSVEAVPSYEGWLIRERDPAHNLIRESTQTFACAGEAYDAWWSGAPVDFEAWIAPMWVTPVVEAA